MKVLKVLKFVYRFPGTLIVLPFIVLYFIISMIIEYNNNIEFHVEMEYTGFSDKLAEKFKEHLTDIGLITVLYIVSTIFWLYLLKQLILN